MTNKNHYIKISLVLIFLTIILFLIHYLIFGQGYNTAYYSLMSVCLIPINILAVTIVFENILEYNSKKEKLNKLNMLVGIFFSEIGYELMRIIISSDANAKNLISSFSNLNEVEKIIKNHKHNINIHQIDIVALENLISDNNTILITAISNDNVLEHEIFTDLLMSIMHLKEELSFMKKNNLYDIDFQHLKIDIMRVYKNLTLQWIKYLYHLEKFYPYLYKNAIQVNPFIYN